MRYWEDFVVGSETVHGEHEITADEIVRFAGEFDPQPFHTDPDGDVLMGRSRVVDAWPSERDPGRGTIIGEHELVNQRGEVVMRMRARGHIARRPG
ncbi:MAG: hypothetical protein ACRDL2_02900 [Gaiellaceae bacterium]